MWDTIAEIGALRAKTQGLNRGSYKTRDANRLLWLSSIY